MPPKILINNLAKHFGSTELFSNLELVIEAGEITALVGPNGCGKSTLLQILSRLVKHDSGRWHIENFDSKRFSYIFQNYRESLLPWRTALSNIILPLKLQRIEPLEISRRVEALRQATGRSFRLESFPYHLSGGQQQMVAFWRALITKPELLFIDESFSALDYEHSLRLRKDLLAYYEEHTPTVVMVSHNVEEAVHLAHTIVIFSERPTRVAKIIRNPLPFPRTTKHLTSDTFAAVRRHVLEAFHDVVTI